MRNLFCKLLLISTIVVIIGSASVRLRADKRAMRNSLVRFGKRGADDFMLPFSELSDWYAHKNRAPFSLAYMNLFPYQDQF